MNNNLTTNTTASRNTWKHIFIGILSLQAILELGVGATLLFNFPVALESGFGITYSSNLDILGVALGLYLVLLSILMMLSAIWTKRNNPSGITLGIIVGIFLLIFGLVSTAKFGGMQGIVVDGIRGFFTIVFGYLAQKEIK